MSLRVRLILLIGVLVTLVALALSALHLNSLANSLASQALDRSELASQQANTFVVGRLNELPDTPETIEASKILWSDTVANDPEIAGMLERTVALSPMIIAINIAGQDSKVLASSNPSRVGEPTVGLEGLRDWRNGPVYRRFRDLVVRRPDYQVTVPLGIAGEPEPIFLIQVVVSSVLLRSQLLPEVQALAAVSGGALLISVLLTIIATERILLPLKRIERTIDRIVQGNYGGDEQKVIMAKEFAVVESKLNLLGQQFRGAREAASEKQHSLDHLLERMASQLDVASRLAAISRITGGVAHEIKNPLNAISLRLDLLKARLGAPEEELAAEIDILSKEVMRLDRVVKTFLDFSRPVEVRFEEVDLAVLAREVTDLLMPQARLAHVAVEFAASDQGESSPLKIRGDADMLKQAILNLVTNAFDAMTDGGSLRINVARSGDTVTMDVADDGPGIPAALRDKVFQLYFSTKSKGSGIGLAMTYRAVQLHNGTIVFTSEDHRGTTFHLEFPALAGHV